MAISGDFHIFIYIEGKNERCESALSTMIDLKGENQKCHIHPGGSARSREYRWHFAKAVTQTKGNSNGDSAAGHLRGSTRYQCLPRPAPPRGCTRSERKTTPTSFF